MSKIRDSSWVILGRVVGLLGPFLVLPLAARTLTKNELGTWALIQVVIGFVSILKDGGLTPYVVRHQNYGIEQRGMARLCGLLLGFVSGVVLIIISIPVTIFLGISEHWKLFLPISLVYAFGGLNSIYSAELRRDTRFRAIFFTTSTPAVFSIAISIGLLLYGAGLWTFPIASVASSLIQLLILTLISRPVSMKWRKNQIKSIMVYTRGLLGFNLINYWARRLDDVLIGKFIGTDGLAIYSNAYRMMMLPINQVVSTLNPLILPYMAKKQNDPADCRNELFSFLKIIGLVAFPLMSLIWLERAIIIHYYLGPGWEEVADLLFWFAPLGMIQCLTTPLGNCYDIAGKNDQRFLYGIANTIVVIFGFIIGLPYGIQGVAVSYFLSNAIMVFPGVHFSIRCLGGNVTEWFKNTVCLWLIPLIGLLVQPITSGFSMWTKIGIDIIIIGVVTVSITWCWFGYWFKARINVNS
ncbi:oligosaccharide flippase family protein [Verrucomicrobiaceae bacterium 5K15]|uniref:Oligosaccharide flippase family protein n=1 Tax=Oceaniferula flava TaxID=2800421 RepID=A0AAE2SGM0_9BACT|nr:oligosaccharide flippase family protein [Oceaniferula flavus]MBK1856509.1 oligosaccharide flippase family protein [Oceaniferula flavus]MBM1137816.1 oligosaccharide flippase family protein [Oceaniferula flavus]